MKNNLKKIIFLFNILFFYFGNVFCQDTLTYNYILKFYDKVYNTWDVNHIIFNDSIFAIENLFDFKLTPFFKIQKEQWFMKTNADLEVFFNEKYDSCGNWETNDDCQVFALWKKTDIIDNEIDIYELHFIPIPQLRNGYIILIDEYMATYYFSSLSGIIAIWGHDYFYIREDKMYLWDKIYSIGPPCKYRNKRYSNIYKK